MSLYFIKLRKYCADMRGEEGLGARVHRASVVLLCSLRLERIPPALFTSYMHIRLPHVFLLAMSVDHARSVHILM